MSDGRRRAFTPIGDLLDDLVEDALPGDPALRASQAAEAFRRVVGPAVARRCRVEGLKGGVLLVAAETPRWQQELERMAAHCLRRVNAELPAPLAIDGIRFTGE